MTKTFPEAISGIRTAVLGREVREDIAQGMEYVEQFAEEASASAEQADASAKAAASYRDAAADTLSKTVRFAGTDQRTGAGFKLNDSNGITYYSDSHRCCLVLTLPENVWSLAFRTLVSARVLLTTYSLTDVAVLLDASGKVVAVETGQFSTASEYYKDFTLTHSDIPDTAKTLVIQSIYRSFSDFPTATARVNRIDALEEKVAQGGSTGTTDIGLSVVDGKLCVTYDNGT